MSDSSALAVSPWQPIAETLSQLHAEQTALDEIVDNLFDELDVLRNEFSRKIRDADADRHLLAEQKAQLDDTVESQQKQLEEIVSELETAREQLRAQEEQEDDRNDERLASMERELAEAEQRLQTQEQLIEQLRDESQRGEESAGDDAIGQLVQERDELQNELETVRSRAVELHETVAEQKREFARQRDEMSSELNLLRKRLDKQNKNLSESTVEPAAPPAPQSAEDPVVQSVMAQFARLQQDAATRRKAT